MYGLDFSYLRIRQLQQMRTTVQDNQINEITKSIHCMFYFYIFSIYYVRVLFIVSPFLCSNKIKINKSKISFSYLNNSASKKSGELF